MKNLSAYRRLIAGAATAVLMAAPIIAGRAQEPRRLAQPDSVPLDPVTALVVGGGLGGDPQILVGSFPGWIANRLYMPTNARERSRHRAPRRAWPSGREDGANAEALRCLDLVVRMRTGPVWGSLVRRKRTMNPPTRARTPQ